MSGDNGFRMSVAFFLFIHLNAKLKETMLHTRSRYKTIVFGEVNGIM